MGFGFDKSRDEGYINSNLNGVNSAKDHINNNDNTVKPKTSNVNTVTDFKVDYGKIYQLKILKYMNMGIVLEDKIKSTGLKSINANNGEKKCLSYACKISVPERIELNGIKEKTGEDLREKFKKEIESLLKNEYDQINDDIKKNGIVSENFNVIRENGEEETDVEKIKEIKKKFAEKINEMIKNNTLGDRDIVLDVECEVRKGEVWCEDDKKKQEGLYKDATEVIGTIGKNKFMEVGRKLEELMGWVEKEYGKEKVEEIKKKVEECGKELKKIREEIGREIENVDFRDGIDLDDENGLIERIDMEEIDEEKMERMGELWERAEKLKEELVEVMGEEVWERYEEIVREI